MSGLLLLDKDGTLVRPKSGNQFIQTPWDQEPIPGVREALEKYKGWAIAIVSNQGGVAAGHKTLEETFLEFRYCLELFPQIEKAYFCPNFEGDRCWECWGDCEEQNRIFHEHNKTDLYLLRNPNCRKPGAGMLLLAADNALQPVVMVGDRPEDEGAAIALSKEIPCQFIWAEDWRR